jgi:hypothetical protein
VTPEIAALNTEPNGKDDLGRRIPHQAPYWDLDLLTPDDVCALLKVKKAGSTTQLRAEHSRPSD